MNILELLYRGLCDENRIISHKEKEGFLQKHINDNVVRKYGKEHSEAMMIEDAIFDYSCFCECEGFVTGFKVAVKLLLGNDRI
jgi:hypothetical protein